MKNVLLIGQPNAIFIRDFCAEVLNEPGVNTVILCYDRHNQYEDDYEKYGIKIVEWPALLKAGKKGIFSVTFFYKIVKYIFDRIKLKRDIYVHGPIDIVFVHFVNPLYLTFFYSFWKKAKKRILVFWGSDILRASDRNIKLFPVFLRQATSIVFMIQKQCDFFQKKLGHQYDDKVQIIDFGNNVLREIDTISRNYTRRQCKEKLGLPADKILVHVGYNANPAQQHFDLIQSIVAWGQKPLSREWTDKLCFVFPVAYGKEEDYQDYKNNITSLMDSAALDYIFVDEFFQDERLAMFRKTCDIFLYGRKTDAASASTLEYIYAGALFICPECLTENYSVLDEGCILFYSYKHFDDLPDVFNRCLLDCGNMDRGECIDVLSEKGKQVIRESISWENLTPKWRRLYNGQ